MWYLCEGECTHNLQSKTVIGNKHVQSVSISYYTNQPIFHNREGTCVLEFFTTIKTNLGTGQGLAV